MILEGDVSGMTFDEVVRLGVELKRLRREMSPGGWAWNALVEAERNIGGYVIDKWPDRWPDWTAALDEVRA